jgi:hypothetical protein
MYEAILNAGSSHVLDLVDVAEPGIGLAVEVDIG